MQNGFTEPLTLTFDLLTPESKSIPLRVISYSYTKFEHVGIIPFSYAADKQTNRQTNRRSRTFYPRKPT